MEEIKELIKKYREEWEEEGPSSGISYSRLVTHLESILQRNNEAKAVRQNEQTQEVCFHRILKEDCKNCSPETGTYEFPI